MVNIISGAVILIITGIMLGSLANYRDPHEQTFRELGAFRVAYFGIAIPLMFFLGYVYIISPDEIIQDIMFGIFCFIVGIMLADFIPELDKRMKPIVLRIDEIGIINYIGNTFKFIYGIYVYLFKLIKIKFK